MTNAKPFTGKIMRGDAEVAAVEKNQIVCASDGAPLHIKTWNNFEMWLEDRAVDLTRSTMRAVLRHLGISNHDGISAVRYVFGASLTDSFWIKEEGQNLMWQDVRFLDDGYFKAALHGDPDLDKKIHSPELTNIGSFNKGWKREGGKWVLYKQNSAFEAFSEVFVSKLAEVLGINTVKYTYVGDGVVRSDCFACGGWSFEPAKSVVGLNLDYGFNYDVMKKFGFQNDYMNLIFLDTLVRNFDRHEFNYGFLTNDSGEIRLAPSFDYNLSLFCHGIPKIYSRNDIMVREFNDLQNRVSHELPFASENEIKLAFIEVEFLAKSLGVAFEQVRDFCLNAHEQITLQRHLPK